MLYVTQLSCMRQVCIMMNAAAAHTGTVAIFELYCNTCNSYGSNGLEWLGIINFNAASKLMRAVTRNN